MASAKELIQKILDGIEKLTTLEIITAVVPANSGAKGLTRAEILGESREVMCSIINLIDGDITTRIPESFVGSGPFQDLRAFHLEREKEGHKIIADNIAALKALIDLALDADRKSKT